MGGGEGAEGGGEGGEGGGGGAVITTAPTETIAGARTELTLMTSVAEKERVREAEAGVARASLMTACTEVLSLSEVARISLLKITEPG